MAFLFVGTVIMFCFLLVRYTDRENGAFTKLLQRTEANEKLVQANIASVGNNNSRVNEIEKALLASDSRIRELNDCIQNQAEKIIDLKNCLANKRPVIKITQPLQFVPIQTKGKGVKSLIREN